MTRRRPGTGPVTAADLVAERNRLMREDPEYRAEVERAQAERARQVDERRLACRPVVVDLAAAGVHVDSLGDLYQHPEAYSRAIPVLLHHLRGDYPERTLSDIGHALPFKPSPDWWDDYKALYLETTSEAVRDRVAAAMGNAAVRRHYEEVLEFLNDGRLGESRVYFLRPAHRIGNRIEAGMGRAVVKSVRADNALATEAAVILSGKSPKQ